MPSGSRSVGARRRTPSFGLAALAIALAATLMVTLMVTLAATLASPALAASTASTSIGTAPAKTPATNPAANARTKRNSRAAVAALWRSEWRPAARSRISLSGGSALLCLPYQTSATTLSTMLRALNFARRLSGVAPLTSLGDAGGGASLSALIQAANQTLTHTPSHRLSCYTSSGAEAARHSNLGLWGSSANNWRPTISKILRAYLSDSGRGNAPAAHRLWLLRTAARKLTTGFAVSRAGGWTWVSNSTVVFPNSADVRSGPKFHAWPGKGYFPIQLEPHGRWSLSAASPKVSFRHARIRVTRNGHRVKVKRLIPTTSYGDNSLTWQLAARPKLRHRKTVKYCVKVSHIRHARNYRYCTRLFRA